MIVDKYSIIDGFIDCAFRESDVSIKRCVYTSEQLSCFSDISTTFSTFEEDRNIQIDNEKSIAKTLDQTTVGRHDVVKVLEKFNYEIVSAILNLTMDNPPATCQDSEKNQDETGKYLERLSHTPVNDNIRISVDKVKIITGKDDGCYFGYTS